MRSSAPTWSTTTLFVSGSFLPLAISDSRRSTRKMMSMGPSLPGASLAARAVASPRTPIRASIDLVSGLPERSRAQRTLERLGGRTGHQRADITTELGNLAHERRADVALLERRHEEHRVDVRRKPTIVVCKEHLGLEIGDRAQAAHDRTDAFRPTELDREAVEGLDVHALGERRQLAQRVDIE